MTRLCCTLSGNGRALYRVGSLTGIRINWGISVHLAMDGLLCLDRGLDEFTADWAYGLDWTGIELGLQRRTILRKDGIRLSVRSGRSFGR